MSWRDLLKTEKDRRVLPWIGGRKITDQGRSWGIQGKLPKEYGWYTFDMGGGRKATIVGKADADMMFEDGRTTSVGYLVGNRLIPDDARVDPNPKRLVEQTREVHLVEVGLEQFTRALVVRLGQAEDILVFMRQEFPLGPENAVLEAYLDQKKNISHVPGVTPALDLAFRFCNEQRKLAEIRRLEMERLRLADEAERLRKEMLAEAMEQVGTGAGRRAVARAGDFETAAKAALAVSGADLLAVKQERGGRKDHMVVQYRFRGRRLECVADRNTLRITDAGICLTNHGTGEKGDTYFTLESLPTVIGQAMDEDKLVVWRNI